MASVNRPTDTAVKERDINQKLQLYGIFQAFSNGKVPSNQQIDVALNSTLASRAFSTKSTRLSSEGQKLVADLKEVIIQAKYLLLSKNEGNLLQDFIWSSQHVDGGNARTPGAPIDKATAQQHGDQALDGLKTLGRLVLSNGQFRKLLNDATVLLRDMAGDAAQTAANKVNPSEDQLNSIDEPAADNTWHDVPDLSRENLRSQARSTVDKNKPFSREEAKDAARQGANHAQNQQTGDNREAGRAGLSHVAENLQSKAQQNVPDDRQDDAKNAKNATVQNTKNYVNKKMPQERRDQTIWRLKKMVAEIQGHQDYQDAIETLLSLAETYGGHATNVGKQSHGAVKGAHDDNSLQSAEANLKTLIERFANSTSTDDFFDSLNQIYRDADRDPELKHWFQRLDRYIRKCLQEQGYILQDQATDEWNQIYDKGHHLLRERYRGHTDRILDEVKFLADQFDRDPQNKAFGDAVQRLFLDLGNDENGNPTFKPHLIKDLTDVIIPGIFENTRYVPIPRIEVSDPMIDAVVENLVIESDNLFPNVLEFGNDNYFRMGRKSVASKNSNKITIAASGIQMDLKDVAYYVKKKQGFPSVTDKGLMDIFLGGEGFSFKLSARNAGHSDRTHFVAVDDVVVNIKNLNIKLKQSNHKLLFAIAKPLLLKVMKPVLTKVIEKQIRDAFGRFDEFAYGIHQDVQRGKKAAMNDPEQAQNIYQQYWNSYQAKMTAKKEKAKEKTSNMNVNIAMTKEDSMFKNISLPGGISTKATEYKQLAAKGNRWESPIFSMGSARASSDIPKLAQVTRKHHNTATAAVRGGNHPNAEGNQSSGQGYGSGMSSGYGGQSGAGSNYGTQGGYGSQGGMSSGGAGYGNQGGLSSGTGGLSSGGAGYGNQGGLSSGTGGLSSGGDGYGNQGGLSSSGAGYGNQGGLSSGGAGYGNQGGLSSGGAGYGNQGGLSSGGAGYGNQSALPNPNAGAGGFTNQVEQAFDTNKNIGGTTGATGASNGSANNMGSSTFYDSITK